MRHLRMRTQLSSPIGIEANSTPPPVPCASSLASNETSSPSSVSSVPPRPAAKPSKAGSKSIEPCGVTVNAKSVYTPDCTWIA